MSYSAGSIDLTKLMILVKPQTLALTDIFTGCVIFGEDCDNTSH